MFLRYLYHTRHLMTYPPLIFPEATVSKYDWSARHWVMLFDSVNYSIVPITMLNNTRHQSLFTRLNAHSAIVKYLNFLILYYIIYYNTIKGQRGKSPLASTSESAFGSEGDLLERFDTVHWENKYRRLTSRKCVSWFVYKKSVFWTNF